MITTINKDILTVDKGVIVHSVNCIGAIGGLAGAIARKWPKNADAYRMHIKQQKYPTMLLGNVFEVKVAHNVIVANLFGQNNIGTKERQTEYAALISGFKKIAQTTFYGDDKIPDYSNHEYYTSCNAVFDIYIPYKIGCGLGGGDWKTVEDIIYTSFESSGKDIYICRHL